jgi:hypothetical protein
MPSLAGGSDVTVTVAIVPSMSAPDRLTAMSVSSLPLEVEAVAVGRSLTSVTVSVTVAVDVSVPSVMV